MTKIDCADCNFKGKEKAKHEFEVNIFLKLFRSCVFLFQNDSAGCKSACLEDESCFGVVVPNSASKKGCYFLEVAF